MDILQERAVENLTFWVSDLLVKQATVYSEFKDTMSKEMFVREFGTIKFMLPRRRGNSLIAGHLATNLVKLNFPVAAMISRNLGSQLGSKYINEITQKIVVVDAGGICHYKDIKAALYKNEKIDIIVIIGEI